jgi:hypothetical protein
VADEIDANLTSDERAWIDGWRNRCDADPTLMRHEGYVEMFESILRHRLGAAAATSPGAETGR